MPRREPCLHVTNNIAQPGDATPSKKRDPSHVQRNAALRPILTAHCTVRCVTSNVSVMASEQAHSLYLASFDAAVHLDVAVSKQRGLRSNLSRKILEKNTSRIHRVSAPLLRGSQHPPCTAASPAAYPIGALSA